MSSYLGLLIAVVLHAWHHMQAKRGGLRDTDAVDLLSAVFKGVLLQTKIDPKVRHGCMSACAALCTIVSHVAELNVAVGLQDAYRVSLRFDLLASRSKT